MKKGSVTDDSVVQEVREARARLYREGGGTIEGYIRAVHEAVKELRVCRNPKKGGRQKAGLKRTP